MKKSPPTFIDLFCGCGGFTLGMLRAGFRCLAAIDSNKEAVETLKQNLVDKRHPGFEPPVHALEKDLTQLLPVDLAKLIGTKRLDVIVGGPPCQGFSTARQRDGSNHGTGRLKDDARRHLYRHFLDHVEFFQPRVFVIENVLGLRTAGGGRYFTAVQHEARVLGRVHGLPGYRVHSQIEDATDLGVPQKRRRQLIVGVRNDLPGYFTSKLVPAKRATIGTMLGDAICDLPILEAGRGQNDCDYDFERRCAFLAGRRGEIRQRYLSEVLEVDRTERLTNHVARPHSSRDLRDFARIPEGKSSADLMRAGVDFEFPYDKNTFKDRYTRQHRNRPCSTIVAHLSKDGLMFIHPTQNRSLSPREAARAQTFPDWFSFPKARTHSFRMIGNAVPPLVGESVGLALRSFLTTSGSIPTSTCEAKDRLGWLMNMSARELRNLDGDEFRFGWSALLYLFPGLHPENALDHGETIEELTFDQLVLPGFEGQLSRRFLRSGWPVALKLIGLEAWRRYRNSELTNAELFCDAAQLAGIRQQGETFGVHGTENRTTNSVQMLTGDVAEELPVIERRESNGKKSTRFADAP